MHRLQQNAAIRQPHPHVRRREHRNDRDHRLGLTPPHTTEHATRREHRNDRDHRLGLTPAPHTTGQRITREEHRNDRHYRLGLTPPHTTEHATRREHRNDRDHRLGLTPAPHTTGQRITREEHRNDRHHRLGLTPLSTEAQRAERAPDVSQLVRDRNSAINTATAAPTAPLIAITRLGANRSAAAPARIIATPWPRLIPPWARPNA
jgi:hypothetical protein